jgi:hypothetical protein
MPSLIHIWWVFTGQLQALTWICEAISADVFIIVTSETIVVAASFACAILFSPMEK